MSVFDTRDPLMSASLLANLPKANAAHFLASALPAIAASSFASLASLRVKTLIPAFQCLRQL